MPTAMSTATAVMIPSTNNLMTGSVSRQLQPEKDHEAGRIAPIEGLQSGWKTVFADQSADAELEMIRDGNIANTADGQLVDRKHRETWSGLGHPFHHVLQKLILGYTLCPHEQRVGLVEDDFALEEEAVECIARVVHLPAPGEGRAPEIVLSERLGVGRRCRDAILVHLRRQLFRRMQMPCRDL